MTQQHAPPSFATEYFVLNLIGALAFLALASGIIFALCREAHGGRKTFRLFNFAGTYIWAAISLLIGFTYSATQLLGTARDFGFPAIAGALGRSALVFISPLIALFTVFMLASGFAAIVAVLCTVAFVVSSKIRTQTENWYYSKGKNQIKETIKMWKSDSDMSEHENRSDSISV